jgi:hypothetical protein
MDGPGDDPTGAVIKLDADTPVGGAWLVGT